MCQEFPAKNIIRFFVFICFICFIPLIANEVNELEYIVYDLEEKIWQQEIELKLIQNKLKRYQKNPPSFFKYKFNLDQVFEFNSHNSDKQNLAWSLGIKKSFDFFNMQIYLIEDNYWKTALLVETNDLEVPFFGKNKLELSTGPGEIMNELGELKVYPDEFVRITSYELPFTLGWSRKTNKMNALQLDYVYTFSILNEYSLRFVWGKSYYYGESIKNIIRNDQSLESRDLWVLDLILNKVQWAVKYIKNDLLINKLQFSGYGGSTVVVKLIDVAKQAIVSELGDDYEPLGAVDIFNQPIYADSVGVAFEMNNIFGNFYFGLSNIDGSYNLDKKYCANSKKIKTLKAKLGYKYDISKNISLKMEYRYLSKNFLDKESSIFTKFSLFF